MIKYIVYILLFSGFSMVFNARSEEPDVSRVEVRAAPGSPFPDGRIPIGVRFAMDDGWHTYAENPGDSGLPPEIKVSGPDGMRLEKWKFPPHTVFQDAAGTTYGYEREVVLLGAVYLPAETGETVKLKFEIDWMVCREACIPLSAKLELTVVNRPVPDADRRGWETFLEAGGWSACVKQEKGAEAPGGDGK